MAGFEGKALFVDCDIILRTDIKALFDQITDETVMCVKHDYTPKSATKYLGNVQYSYPRKNWSSVMLFNADKCTHMTPEYVNKATPAELHRMAWAAKIGELDPTWNHLCGEYEPNAEAKLVHFTLGTPCFQGYEEQEHSKEWYELRNEVNYCVD